MCERLIKEERLIEDDSTSSASVASRGEKINAEMIPKTKDRWKTKVKYVFTIKREDIAYKCRKKRKKQSTKEEIEDVWRFKLCVWSDQIWKSRTFKIVREASSETEQDTIKLRTECLAITWFAETKYKWCMDHSDGFKHITFRRDWLVNMKPVSSETVSLGDKDVCEIRGIT